MQELVRLLQVCILGWLCVLVVLLADTWQEGR